MSVRKLRNLSWMREPAFCDTLGEALDGDAPSTYVTADRIPATAELVELAGAGWEVSAENATPTLRRDGRTVRWLHPWTGRAMTAGEAADFWRALSRVLARVAPGARPFGSPGTVGRDLWLRSLSADAAYPVLSPDTQETIRSIAGQGRIEVLPARSETVPALFELDARLAYLSCMSNLPVGEPTRVDRGTLRWLDEHPFAPGWARADWTAPLSWTGPGILPGSPAAFDTGGRGYPRRGYGWVSLAALALARRNGWTCSVIEVIAWERTANPFRGFLKVIHAGMQSATMVDPAAWRTAWRAMALHPIGAMYAAPRRVSHFVPMVDDWEPVIPEHAENIRVLPATGAVRYVTTEGAQWDDTHHPEWSATIWERARVRLLDAAGVDGRVGALHVPDTCEVVGFRTDALYLTESPGWADDGAIGRYRVKRAAMGPFAWPQSQGELLGLFTS